MEYKVIHTSGGQIRGRRKDFGITEYLGIPYAHAERFCPPEPASWTDVRDCLTFGPKSLQISYLGEKPQGAVTEVLGEENCLNLNVWAADHEAGEKLPVVVYVHGGAFQVGSNSVPTRTGEGFMEQYRMVFVSVNYRLGVMGFLQLGPEMGEKYRFSGNCGAMDVLCALEWVHENIAAFGGDPERVTLLGISAGAKMIGSLLTLPRLQALSHQVVMESGAMQSFRMPEAARRVAERYEQILGISSERELLTLPAEKLLLAQAELCDEPGTTCLFGPVMDGELFDPAWEQRWRAGEGWRGNAILGSSRRELGPAAGRADFGTVKDTMLRNLFGAQSGLAGEKAEELFAELRRAEGNTDGSAMLARAVPADGGQVTDRFRAEHAVWTEVLSDFMYRYYTDQLAERMTAAGNDVWVYSFEYGVACHGMGFSYLMNEVNKPNFRLTAAEAEIGRGVAAAMREQIRRFICTGAPQADWPQFDGKNKMIFDAAPHVEERRGDTLSGFPEMVYR